MRTPVKLNRAFWPRALTAVLPSAHDPRILSHRNLDETAFSDAVSTFKFGKTCKTTEKARFPLSIDVLSSLQYERAPVILDVGASDGVTSLDVMRAVPFEKYFVTDAHMEVVSDSHRGRTYFYAADAQCILIATGGWIIYQDTAGALPPFGSIARCLFSRAPKMRPDSEKITLINPALQARLPGNARIEQYDILREWPHEKVDLVIAANILNRSYFSEKELLQALDNLVSALREDGRLAIIENRDLEKATIFRLAGGRPSIERRVNGGSEIELLVKDFPSPSIPLPKGEGRTAFLPPQGEG